MYLGFNYDLARGMQDELLRWADEQRRIKRVRSRQPAEEPHIRSKLEAVQAVSEKGLERRAS